MIHVIPVYSAINSAQKKVDQRTFLFPSLAICGTYEEHVVVGQTPPLVFWAQHSIVINDTER